jgi:hypothetical protein
MPRHLATGLILLAAVASSCTGAAIAPLNQDTQGHVHLRPPADHGGYHGARARVFDAAYTACYRSIAKSHGMPSSDPNNPLNTIAQQPTPQLAQAAEAGCQAGLTGWAKAQGFHIAEMKTTTTHSGA